MPILGVITSNHSIYRLAQTYTSAATYTVPNGIYQISGIAVGKGGLAVAGQASGGNGGYGGGGAGGGAIYGFWAKNVTPGQTFAIGFSTGNTTITDNTDANYYIVSGAGGDASAATGGAAGGGAVGSNVPSIYRLFASGGAGGNGGATRTTNGNGNTGLSGTSGSSWVPVGPLASDTYGLPTLVSGAGGGGGGGGAKASNLQFLYGGSGGSPNGGSGGDAQQDGFLQGYAGSNGLRTEGTAFNPLHLDPQPLGWDKKIRDAWYYTLGLQTACRGF